ncbi:CHAT domain-containing protein [Phormidium sp. FACHB-592]|uniref:CHAT domain-containing protein n=1 Tax=Stenomitos frigidus AS-A4 TaxID=2933935 RepID=A0ABV0KRR3_9CYAN|nr:CHAT domain-containing protein [Phormidium sp. FACHB-592]MBD2075836.1 CHAT domain-containing protein [Phormidium sp. FACHB-592]
MAVLLLAGGVELTGGRAEAKDNVCLRLSCRSNVISAYDQSVSTGETSEEAVQALIEPDGVYSSWHRQFQPVLTTVAPATDAAQLIKQGRSHYQAGQFAPAIAAWQQAATAYKEQGDALNQALVGSYLALAYQQSGNLDEAWRLINTSLTLLSSFNTSQSTRIRAQVFNAQGSLQFAQGQTEAALKTWQQTTALYQQLGDQPRWLGSLINQVQAQQALGLFLRARQTLDQVEQWLQQQPDSALKALGLRSLGNVLLAVGDVTTAEQVLEQSLMLLERKAPIGNVQSLNPSDDRSAILLSLGNVARAQNDVPTALKWYQAVDTNALPLTRTQALLNQLSLLPQASADTQALILVIQAQLEALPPSRASIYARINLAQSLLRSLDSINAAAQTLAVAVQHADGLADQRAKAYALGYLAHAYERTHQWAEAQTLTKQALLLAQSVNTPEIAYQWQWQLGRILNARGQRMEAIRAYEAAYQTLRSVRGDLTATSPDVQFSFRERVEPVYREFVALLLQSPSNANLKQAREVIESLRLAELDNFFRTACLEGQSVAIDTINQTDAAIVYPIILANRLEVILSLPNQPLRHYAVAVTQQTVETTIEQLRQNLEKPLTTPEGKQSGQHIYNWLMQPIAAELDQRSIKTLVFVLDGALRNVPMAAMYDGRQYLIERYGIAIAPSLQLLNPRSLQQQGLQTLAAGLSEARHGFGALSNVGSELNEIQAEVPSRVLLNQTFTSAALQDQIKQLPFPIVHLATHGQFSSDANETFVLAWDKPIKVTELASLLRSRDDLSENAIELLVLSACETATGDKRAALGLAGVAVQAGARSTIASLWSLDDESGARFMSQLYRQLVNAKVSKAEAVRQSQLALLRDPNFRHPRYWAPYVLLGNWL